MSCQKAKSCSESKQFFSEAKSLVLISGGGGSGGCMCGDGAATPLSPLF